MKKFTKVCLILIAVCAALGLAFCLIGWCMNGKLDRNPFLHFGHGIQIGWTDETLDDLADFVNHAADGTAAQGTDVAETDEVQSIFGDEEVREVLLTGSGEDAEELSFSLGGGSAEFIVEDRENIRVCVNQKYADQVQCSFEEGELEIQAVKRESLTDDCPVLTVQLPEDLMLQDLDIEVNAGVLKAGSLAGKEASVAVSAGKAKIEKLEAKEADLRVQAGGLTLETLECDTADAECDAGALNINGGRVKNTGEFDCNVGAVNVRLQGDPESYTCQLDCAVGSITLNGKKYAGAVKTTVQGTDTKEAGSRKMELSCNMGSITLDIQEASGTF